MLIYLQVIETEEDKNKFEDILPEISWPYVLCRLQALTS